eukprot:COSAG02_NODE_3284_length_7013_cov_159.733584_1_plen_80_part_00
MQEGVVVVGGGCAVFGLGGMASSRRMSALDVNEVNSRMSVMPEARVSGPIGSTAMSLDSPPTHTPPPPPPPPRIEVLLM